jgi:hypothetical protein
MQGVVKADIAYHAIRHLRTFNLVFLFYKLYIYQCIVLSSLMLQLCTKAFQGK